MERAPTPAGAPQSEDQQQQKVEETEIVGPTKNGKHAGDSPSPSKKRKRVNDRSPQYTKMKRKKRGKETQEEGDTATDPPPLRRDCEECKNGRDEDEEAEERGGRDGDEEKGEEIYDRDDGSNPQELNEQADDDDEDRSLPHTPEQAHRDYQSYCQTTMPPSIKLQRKDAIRKHKQVALAQYPANFRGHQLFPPQFDPDQMNDYTNSQTRKFRQLSAQTSEIRKREEDEEGQNDEESP